MILPHLAVRFAAAKNAYTMAGRPLGHASRVPALLGQSEARRQGVRSVELAQMSVAHAADNTPYIIDGGGHFRYRPPVVAVSSPVSGR